ncbi:MAG TPA: hypothetical protein VJC07_03765 [Candidatus Nanoarchaeia archaeon]|nr:hypothetical protein [Candidatus Nanoarchaeia archaeon]
MADDISKGLVLVVLLITIVLSTFGTYVVLQSSTEGTTMSSIPPGTGRVAIYVEPNNEALANEVPTNDNQGEG